MYKNLCIFLPILAWSFIVPTQSFSQVVSMRPLEKGQAATLIQDLIRAGEISKVDLSGKYEWNFPTENIYSRGVWMNGRGYMVFGLAEQNYLYFLDIGNIPDFVKGAENSQLVTLEKVEGKSFPQKLIGAFYSTVDFEIPNNPVLIQYQAGTWWDKTNTLEKGGYVVFLGSLGITLKGQYGLWFVGFQQPSNKLSIVLPQESFEVEQLLLLDGDGAISFAGHSVFLKDLRNEWAQGIHLVDLQPTDDSVHFQVAGEKIVLKPIIDTTP